MLGLTSAQVTALNADFLEFDTTLTDHVAQRANAKAATAAKDTAKEALLAKIGSLVRIIRGHSVPPALLDELGIGPIDPHSPAHPSQPLLMTVTPYATGTNLLRWERGANKKGTMFVVEVLNATTDGWQYLIATSKLSFRHLNQELGFMQSYRVVALRNGAAGTPSFPVTVYGPEQGSAEAVELRAA